MARKKTGNGEQGAGINGGAGGAQAPQESPSTDSAVTVTRVSTVASSHLPIGPPKADPCTMVSIDLPMRRLQNVPIIRRVDGQLTLAEAEIARDLFDGISTKTGRQLKTIHDVFRHLLAEAGKAQREKDPGLSMESRYL